MTYRSLSTAKRVARMRANRSGNPWAILSRDGLATVRWEILPVARVREDETPFAVVKATNPLFPR